MKNFIEAGAAFLVTLIVFKSLTIITTCGITLFIGNSHSTFAVFINFLFVFTFLSYIAILLLVLLTFVFVFSVAFPDRNNQRITFGFIVGLFAIYACPSFFFGQMGSFNIIADLIFGATLLLARITLGRILTFRFLIRN